MSDYNSRNFIRKLPVYKEKQEQDYKQITVKINYQSWRLRTCHFHLTVVPINSGLDFTYLHHCSYSLQYFERRCPLDFLNFDFLLCSFGSCFL
jgi:hypothetical protein